jgi:hypothetical protein
MPLRLSILVEDISDLYRSENILKLQTEELLMNLVWGVLPPEK